ncbi:MAG: transcriptional repressor [Desulfovibrionaceae bacterium]|jgi:Fur family ferric uptake transcriptional regulator|nr:transcriptional repressor [Desulfovibrionaceae bacterium]
MERQSAKRMTIQRRVILEELRKVTSHPTADEVYEMVRRRLPRVSLGTVYRNLDLLAESGEILKLERAGAQMRFDGNAEDHYHVRCVRCGRVADVHAKVQPPRILDCNVDGFTITGSSLEFFGVCDYCAGNDA